LLEAGVGIRCNNMPTIAFKLDRLLSDRVRLGKMQIASRRMARPNAAREIVGSLMELG